MTSDEPTWRHDGIAPRARVISDNDYSGDTDGLVQLAQHLLSPSVDVRLVVGSRHPPFDPSPGAATDTASTAADAARTIAELTGRGHDVPVVAGSAHPLPDRTTPADGPAAKAIVTEALREDTDLPLYVTCGGGLTDIASAWLLEPRIAARLTLVWIGGHEHDGLASPPPAGTDMEYNLGIDPIAGQVVFNDSDLDIWQVPRNLYRTIIASRAELLARVRPHGALGRHLFDALGSIADFAAGHGVHLGETYILGDSPLVLLTALLSSFQPDAASSTYVTAPCPRILDSGRYEPNPDGRAIRIYTMLDTRLLLEDLYAKLALHASGST